jgi:dTDP-4-dehydrorhamnose reductase
MNILILGSTGQVGFELCRSLAPLGTLFAPDRRQLDLQDKARVDAYLERIQPDLIVNGAAYTAVDKAEEEADIAMRINAELPAQLAHHACRQGIRLVHYSSDYVYQGSGQSPQPESTPEAPLNQYGKSKLAGDQAIRDSGCRHLIFRTSWVYSARGSNFMKTMLKLGQQREQLSVVADQTGAPTPARLIAAVTALSLHSQSTLPDGTYHLTTRGETSWHGFARAIFALASQAKLPLAITPDNVHAIQTADYPTAARRPLNSRLSLARLEQGLTIQLPDWQSQLELTLQEYALSMNGMYRPLDN